MTTSHRHLVNVWRCSEGHDVRKRADPNA